ncbi:hypothetical protein HHK36_004309 [Tetracentron sinense]|uniref:Uncharacterized protein n=1 Tax=Tetracentron sinense TaxID=13715 RepID=A0A835DQ62_TETSI|nr:hypothetical protein HHK36_004309 [Tetracentron sinense]
MLMRFCKFSSYDSFDVDENEEFLRIGSRPVLQVASKGHALHAFVNQKLQVLLYSSHTASASGNGSDITFQFGSPISLRAGKNEIALLSMTVGLQSFLLTFFYIFLQIGLEGEHRNIYRADGINNVKWVSPSKPPKNQPLTWYKVLAKENAILYTLIQVT